MPKTPGCTFLAAFLHPGCILVASCLLVLFFCVLVASWLHPVWFLVWGLSNWFLENITFLLTRPKSSRPQEYQDATRMQQEKQGWQDPNPPDPKNIGRFLLHPGCILTGFRKKAERLKNFEIPFRCNQDATGKTRMTRPKSSRPKEYRSFPVASWLHPNGISKKRRKVEKNQYSVRMPPGCNRKNKDDKTQILQTPKISLFSFRILVAS